jgi:hypothetical protein
MIWLLRSVESADVTQIFTCMPCSVLREFIRQYVFEARDTSEWSKWDRDSMQQRVVDDAEKLLEDNGVEPLRHGSMNTAWLGAGTYSIVFEVLWKGKRAAAKLCSNTEAAVYRRFADIRSSVPARVAAALPEIYDIIDIDLGDKSIEQACPAVYYRLNGPESLNIVVCEYLVPTTLDIRTYYFGEADKKTLKQNAELFKRDRNKLSNAAAHALKMAKINLSVVAAAMPKNSNIEAWTALLDAIVAYKTESDFVSSRRLRSTAFGTIDGIVPGVDLQDEEKRKIIDYVSQHLRGDLFPNSAENYNALKGSVKKSSSPKTRALGKFVQALEWLEKHKDISWYDLHADNVMVRPNTHEFVAADVGLFG